MKKQLSLPLCFIALTIAASCSKEKNDGIWINFINSTPATITMAKSDEMPLGQIHKNGETGYREFKEFNVNSNIPLASFTGYINGKYIDCLPLRCGVGTYNLKPGKYDVLVDTVTYDIDTYFVIRMK